MAIVLDAYTMIWIVNESNKDKRTDKWKKSTMLAFLFTYYHHLRGISLNDDPEIDDEDKEYELIELRDLPGVVAKKWVNKKKRLIDTIRKVNGYSWEDEEELEEKRRWDERKKRQEFGDDREHDFDDEFDDDREHDFEEKKDDGWG